MILKRCKKGHYYDGDKYQSCPHCQEERPSLRARHILRKKTSQDHTVSIHQQREDLVTMLLPSDQEKRGSGQQPAIEEDPPTMLLPSDQEKRSIKQPANVEEDPVTMLLSSDQGKHSAKQQADMEEDPVTMLLPSDQEKRGSGQQPAIEEDPPTMLLSSTPQNSAVEKQVRAAAGESSLTVGWFVCIKGKNLGASFAVLSGRNYIRYTADRGIAVWKDNGENKGQHAAVSFVPRYQKYIMERGETRDLFFLNEELVLGPVELKKYDILSLRDTSLLFVPLCGEGFSWDQLPKP